MSGVPLVITDVDVREAPGMRRGLSPLSELTDGVNIIHGPNGSGKSTTLRLMQACLSPGGRDNPLRSSKDNVELRIKAGDAETTISLRDRTPAETHGHSLDLPSGLVNYTRFSLKELLDSTGREDFGQAIQEAAAGGTDLVRTANSLGLNNRPEPRPSDRKKLGGLRRDLDKSITEAASYEEKERELAELKAEAIRLEEDRERRGLLLRASEHQSHQERADRARACVEAFPPTVANLAGDEADQVRELEGEIHAAEETTRKASEEVRRAKETRTRTNLESPLPPGLIARLRNLEQTLRDLERKREDLTQNLAGAQERANAARSLIGEDSSDEDLQRIGPEALGHLEGWCDKVESHEADRRAFETLKNQLGDLSEPGASQAGASLNLLQEWLAASNLENAAGVARRTTLIVAIVLAVMAVVLGLTVNPWLFLLLAGTATLTLAWFLMSPGRSSGIEKIIQSKGLPTPAEWSPQSVNELIFELEADYKKHLERQGRHEEWAPQISATEISVAAARDQLESERRALHEELGLAPIVGEKCFGLLARALRDWQGSERDRRGLASSLDENENSTESTRERIRTQMGALLPTDAGDDFFSSDVAGWVEDLDERNKIHETANQDLAKAEEEIGNAGAQIERNEGRIREIYDAAGLNAGEFAELGNLVSQVTSYREARRDLDGHAIMHEQAHDFFSEHADLAEKSSQDLEQKLLILMDPSEELQAVNQKIGGIELELDKARRSTAVEEKRRTFEDRRAELHRQREQRLGKLGGWLLAAQIHDEVAAETVPEVHKRADRLLRKFTDGQCELVLSDGKLMALQPGRGDAPVEPETLSDGTRVQLFIAMRLAFVEKEEGAYRMPLFFDEALANTDDHRAASVMKTLISIAADGRQVLYFTSQADEAAKWQRELETSDITHGIFPLEPGGNPPVVAAAIPPLQRIEAPRPDESIKDYAARIGLEPAVDPWCEVLDEIPLACILDDAKDLRNCLEYGIETWGPLSRSGSPDSALGGGEPAFEAVSKRAAFLLEVARLWQQGRGQPLARTDLENAGVTNTSAHKRLDHAWSYALECDLDAERLCNGLEAGELKVDGLGHGGLAKLRAYCEEHGLIMPGTPLPSPDLRLQAGAGAKRIGLNEPDARRMLEFFEARN